LFDSIFPAHFYPSDKELDSTQSKDEHKLHVKFFRKVDQSFFERKIVIFHLFIDLTAKDKNNLLYKWHLITFSENDTDVLENNHWSEGQHIHFINYLWPNCDPQKLMNDFPKTPTKSIHIRYSDD